MGRKKTREELESSSSQLEGREEDFTDFISVSNQRTQSSVSFSNVLRGDLKIGTLLFGIIDQVTEKELLISLSGFCIGLLGALLTARLYRSKLHLLIFLKYILIPCSPFIIPPTSPYFCSPSNHVKYITPKEFTYDRLISPQNKRTYQMNIQLSNTGACKLLHACKQ